MKLQVEELEQRQLCDITPLTPSLPLSDMVGGIVTQHDYICPITPIDSIPIPLTPVDLIRMQPPVPVPVVPQLKLDFK